MQLGVTELCCACHSSSIAALIYIIVVPDMHGQKVVQVQDPRSLPSPIFRPWTSLRVATCRLTFPQSSDRSISYSGRLVDEAVASGRAKLKGRVTQQAFELAGNVVHIPSPSALCAVRFAAPCMAALGHVSLAPSALWAVPFLLRLAGGTGGI